MFFLEATIAGIAPRVSSSLILSSNRSVTILRNRRFSAVSSLRTSDMSGAFDHQGCGCRVLRHIRERTLSSLNNVR